MLTKEMLQNHLKEAMRAKDKTRRETLRLALTAIKLGEVQKGNELNEGELLAIFQKEKRMRQEAMADAEKAGRKELISDLQAELSILETYLPEALSSDEIMQLAQEAIIETNAKSPKEMGIVMKALMPRVQGRADGSIVSQIVRSLLMKD
jgi:uncharacterized protein YqeY